METPAHLIVDVSRLGSEGETYEGETDAEALALGVASVLCTPVGGIRYALHVEQVDQELLVRGRVSHRFQCVCARCATPFELEVDEPEFFADYPVAETTEFVDLTPEMREAIILALPGYPVCREDCKGLCAHCGANLNREPCTCVSDKTTDEPWSGLDLLGKAGPDTE